MDLINSYGNPVITNWELNDNGEKISVPILNESKQVTGNKIVLEGMPDEGHRVFIDGFIEMDIKDKITEPNQFKVDYRKNGVIFLHESLDGQWITISSYSSLGMYYIPSSRVWTKLNEMGEIVETLDQVAARVEGLNDFVEHFEETIGTAQQTNTELIENIETGKSTDSVLNDSIIEAVDKNTKLDSSIELSITSKSDLDKSIGSSAQSKIDLDKSIVEADSSKLELSTTIVRGDTLRDDLSGKIATSEVLRDALVENISEGGILKAELLPIIADAKKKKDELELSLSNTRNFKTEFDKSIASANTSKTNLDKSIDDANLIHDKLSNKSTGAIKVANEINTELKESTSNAQTGKEKLDISIGEASNSKVAVDKSISAANTTKLELDGSIDTGVSLKGELDGIISGTNFEVIMTDIQDLKKDTHTHTNKTTLDEIEDVSGSLLYKGQQIGVGDMEKSVYDKNDNGKIDMSEDSEKLGGQLPNHYAKTSELHSHTNKDTLDSFSGDADDLKYGEKQVLLKGLTWGDFLVDKNI